MYILKQVILLLMAATAHSFALPSIVDVGKTLWKNKEYIIDPACKIYNWFYGDSEKGVTDTDVSAPSEKALFFDHLKEGQNLDALRIHADVEKARLHHATSEAGTRATMAMASKLCTAYVVYVTADGIATMMKTKGQNALEEKRIEAELAAMRMETDRVKADSAIRMADAAQKAEYESLLEEMKRTARAEQKHCIEIESLHSRHDAETNKLRKKIKRNEKTIGKRVEKITEVYEARINDIEDNNLQMRNAMEKLGKAVQANPSLHNTGEFLIGNDSTEHKGEKKRAAMAA